MSDILLIIKHQIKPFFMGIIYYDVHTIYVGCIEYDKWDNHCANQNDFKICLLLNTNMWINDFKF